ncbi:hypothetical protein OHA72_49855 [Dactylosporangium sp. NBC_01737]|uniref:hypothetical protein n=1 Tax=Dactylosporangium sp. NBC_01737 TaxID=2975959 RepID=UPI002E137BB7|nr:hypothetical protein OHA72_49855 [Dactylosporangium sp. NBC_01737]
MPGYLALGAGSAAGRAGAFASVAGTGLLAFAMTASNLHGEDYGWFPALAVPANALWAAGSVVLAVTTARSRSLPRPLAVALPVIWLSSIMLSQLGGNLLAGVLWAAVAWTAQPARRHRRPGNRPPVTLPYARGEGQPADGDGEADADGEALVVAGTYGTALPLT